MRIGCLQFAPQLGDVDNNLNRADAVLHKANPGDLDLLVLPELAFSGYNFKSLQDIRPFLEHSGSGISSLWARTMALKYGCTVAVGYPEKVEWSSTSSQRSIGPEYYNSAIVVNEDGETIANYRKSFLYDTDETWAQEGDRGFYDGFIPGLGNVSIGICMDLNPYKFQAPWHAFEFANHVLRMDSNLVIVSMAWVTREDRRRFTSLPNEPDMDTLTYWVTRLEPLIRADNQDEIIVIFCNRTGYEDDVTYAGTSAVIGIQDGEVTVYGLLGRGQKELLVVDTNDPPYAKMVYRPDYTGDLEGELKSPEFDNPTDYDEPVEDGDDYEEHASEHGFQNPTSDGDGEVKRSPESATSLSPTFPLRSEMTERSNSPEKPMSAPISLGDKTEAAALDNLAASTSLAPSPAPQPVRPRLIIPETPSIFPEPRLLEPPPSAISVASETSVHSEKSNASEASVATLRSNPRPPEDSTPYPGLHPRGYWSNDPLTTFDEESPMSAPWYWPSSTNHLPVPSAASVSAGGLVGRQPEPFPWSSITSEVQPPSRQDVPIHIQGYETAQELGDAKINSQPPLSNNLSHRTHSPDQHSYSDKYQTSKETVQGGNDPQWRPETRSSSQSQYASDARIEGRSQTPLSEIDLTEAISFYLDGLPQHEEMVDKIRSESNRIMKPDQSTSFMPKDHSQGRVGEPELEHEMIQIAFSPTTLNHDGGSSHRSSSRGNRQHHRSHSHSNVNRHGKEEDRRAKSDYAASKVRSSSQATPRGRSRKTKTSSTGGTAPRIRQSDRTSSADSTRNDMLHSRGQQRAGSRKAHKRDPSFSGHRSRQKPKEEVINLKEPQTVSFSSFQKHGHPPSHRNIVNEDKRPSGQSSPQVKVVPSPDTGNLCPLSPFDIKDESLFSDDSPLYQSNSNFNDSPVSISPGGESSDGGAPGTLPTSMTPRQLRVVSLFNPDTPKAMVFGIDDFETEMARGR
ncbi:hypothetical protein BGZ63DRAFT_404151 [Mariannaea sp. PMI_226]|nr:hypothetical protein BGZ63DRAFT_404151 [Mariannaea sp. PMI_226]